MFYRNLEKFLASWSVSLDRKPLIIRGARQVGKTTLVKKIGLAYNHFIHLNLEKKEDKDIFFNTDNAKFIFEGLLLKYNIQLKEKDKVLLFIDEIQQAPEAIKLLRYFYEELPQIHVIAAGSLLEFVISEVSSMPVGRVEQVVLHPMSFDEFLLAKNNQALYKKWQDAEFEKQWHDIFLAELWQYMVVGGMPASIQTYIRDENSFKNLIGIFENLWLSYIEDSKKYGRNETNKKVLQYVMENAPFFLERFSFASFGKSFYKGRELSEAFSQLQQAKVLQLIYPTTSLTIPLQPDIKKRPRIQFLDTGLLLFINKTNADVLHGSLMNHQFRGNIFNHLVYQEVAAMSHSPLQRNLFWVREEASTNSEVDLLYSMNGKVFPIEVKSGATGRLRSLFEFMDRAEHAVAVRVSSNTFSVEMVNTIKAKEFKLINIPIYAVGKLNEILSSHL